jgi:8-oxo-dGTP diphosphatase
MREYPDAPRVGVGIVLLRGDEVLLVKRARPPGAGQWSLPGGAQELGETAEECAKRELFEETGLQAGPFHLVAHADSMHRDASGRLQYHYTILDFGSHYVAGDAIAGDDVSESPGCIRTGLTNTTSGRKRAGLLR